MDRLGFLVAVAVTVATGEDARAAPQVLVRLPASVRDVYADSKNHNYALYGFTGRSRASYKLVIVSRPPRAKG